MNQLTARLPAGGRTSRAGAKLPLKAGVAAVAVGALIAAAIGNHLAAERTEGRNPPAGRFVTVDGVRLHYQERGHGPTLVLIHGNGVSSEDYVLSGLFDALAQGHRVIAFDRPGFGYSARPRNRSWTAQHQARLLLEAMTALDVPEAVLVAHSWGTLVAMQAALTAPDRVRGLVLMSGYYWPTARLDVPLLGGPAIPGLGDVMRFTASPLLGRLMTPLVLKQMFSPAEVPDHFRRGFASDMSLRPSQLRATAADTARMPLEAGKLAGRLKAVAGPVLILSGDGDRIVSCEHQSRRLARELPGGEIQVVEGAGHMLHHIRPQAVAEAVAGFLRQIAFDPDRAGPRADPEPRRLPEPLPLPLPA
ncbi:alpha/beta fold hydrolase [Phenylobacterium deserti]|uniref:Alpha/beta hydrolase n=1 Tax=Phenylobacterium deserti TaxID=1914756 RepID=A0A328AH62_9CAUL|nr:alpha/beta hydrolase [Phenylobacterium deserti]RAK52704.1 alpha/beta hydrolase [Phenylobacterium deserti]